MWRWSRRVSGRGSRRKRCCALRRRRGVVVVVVGPRRVWSWFMGGIPIWVKVNAHQENGSDQGVGSSGEWGCEGALRGWNLQLRSNERVRERERERDWRDRGQRPDLCVLACLMWMGSFCVLCVFDVFCGVMMCAGSWDFAVRSASVFCEDAQRSFLTFANGKMYEKVQANKGK